MDETTQEQINQFDSLRGTKGSHFELANRIESLGLFVQADPDDNERSLVLLPGAWNPDGSDCVIGEIRGDSEAEII